MKLQTALKAGDIMASPLITIDKDTPIHEAAATLSEHKISGAPVVDYGGEPVGVVSMFDIVTYMAGIDRAPEDPGGFYRYTYPRFQEGGEGWDAGWEESEIEGVKETPVAEIMSPDIISVPEDLPIAEVARTLWKHHIHRVTVSRRGKLVGIITTMDLLKALTEELPG